MNAAVLHLKTSHILCVVKWLLGDVVLGGVPTSIGIDLSAPALARILQDCFLLQMQEKEK